jgi:hypothetical protein
MLTYIKPSWDKDKAFFVETWWDNSSRQWITQVKDSNLIQRGEAKFSANKQSAQLAHKQVINRMTDGYIPYVEQYFMR